MQRRARRQRVHTEAFMTGGSPRIVKITGRRIRAEWGSIESGDSHSDDRTRAARATRPLDARVAPLDGMSAQPR